VDITGLLEQLAYNSSEGRGEILIWVKKPKKESENGYEQGCPLLGRSSLQEITPISALSTVVFLIYVKIALARPSILRTRKRGGDGNS